eukprot:TRINITY_DN558_c0_g1_i3.p1 TRINITY_DN558_c0_g1~~TRINITY_DN558_c0_g1_i3.p1  ORF type:complete len:179 (-),score=14.78 TRINITY_DN558_c0_g1_i3:354-890(-)
MTAVQTSQHYQSSSMSTKLANPPTLLEYGDYRFVIMDAPTDANLPAYIHELQRYNVDTVVRACEPTYSVSPLKAAGMEVVELPFVDGDPPPENIVTTWLQLLAHHTSTKKERAIAVHCVAGLGRAPVLIAIALIEKGEEPYDAIAFIRHRRRGAINHRQMGFLEKYTPRTRKDCCLIS